MKEYKGLINLDFPKTPYSTYIMYSEDLSDKSIYIGVTEGYIQRAYKHSIDRFHKNLDVYDWMNNIIEIQKKKVLFKLLEKEKYTEKEAYLKEIELIKEYKEKGYNVINTSNGGKGNSGNIPWNKGKKTGIIPKSAFKKGQISYKKGTKLSDETKNLVSKTLKERKNKGLFSSKRKTVYKYNKEGILISEYNCLKDAASSVNSNITSIGEWCRGKKTPRNNDFKWSYIKL